MAAHRNGDGYALTSQNYFSDLSRFFGKTIPPVSHQAIAKARNKLDWQAFRFLLQQANQDETLSQPCFRYQGHITRAIDGTQLTLPRTHDLLELFESHGTRAGESHYPAALLVTAMNVFTGQYRAARVVNHIESERDQLRSMIELDFKAGDIAILDRGFHGDEVFLCFEEYHQFYLCRMRAAEQRRDAWIHQFLLTGKKEQVIVKKLKHPGPHTETELRIRFILGPKDHEGKPVVLATNLLDIRKYSRKSLLRLYGRRWAVETMYGRVKTLLQLERFHSKTYNGIMQEIFANLLVISLTSLVVLESARSLKLDPDIAVPSFKNAQAVVKRHFFEAIQMRRRLTPRKAKQLAQTMVQEASRMIWKKQPGRSYPRVSMQPVKVWGLYKKSRLKEFKKMSRP